MRISWSLHFCEWVILLMYLEFDKLHNIMCQIVSGTELIHICKLKVHQI